jgi:hypothetical protein
MNGYLEAFRAQAITQRNRRRAFWGNVAVFMAWGIVIVSLATIVIVMAVVTT